MRVLIPPTPLEKGAKTKGKYCLNEDAATHSYEDKTSYSLASYSLASEYAG
jgi:hypothetical protein